jgi:hypothetical protein
MGDYTGGNYPPPLPTSYPPPAQGGTDWLQQLSPASLIASILRFAVPGASGLMDQVANDQAIRADQARFLRSNLASYGPYQAALASGANPANGGVGWSGSPFSIFPEAPAGPGPNLPPEMQQNLGFQMAPGPQRDAYMKGLSTYHAPGMVPQGLPVPVMTEPLARSWLLQTQAAQGGFSPFGPWGGTPGNIPMSGWTWDPKTGYHMTGQTERIPEQPQPAPFPGAGPGAGRGLPGRQAGTTRRLTSDTSADAGTYIPPFDDGTVKFPGGSIGLDGVQVTGADGSKWARNPDNSLTPVSPAPAPAPAPSAGTPPAPPPPSTTPPAAGAGAPGVTSAAPPPPVAQPPAPSAAPGAPGASTTPQAAAGAPSPADMDAARKRLQQKYGSPPGRTGNPPPAPEVAPGELAGAQVGTSLAAPPGTAPGAETPSLPARLIGALGPSPAAAADTSFMPPPGSQPATAPAKPAAAPTLQPAPAPPSTGGTIATEAKDPGQTFNRISDAAVGFPGFADDLKRRYHVTDLNQIKPSDLVNDKYAVAIGNMYARQLQDEQVFKRGEMTQQARVKAERERVQDMYNVVHLHFSQVLGYTPDGKPITALDASSPSAAWSAITPVTRSLNQAPWLRNLGINSAAEDYLSPSGWMPPYGANYLKQTDPGPAGAAAARMLQADGLAISVARAFGTSGRINQTELNIIMNKILPNADTTYAGNVHNLQNLEANLKALAAGANVQEARARVGLPPLNESGEAAY